MTSYVIERVSVPFNEAKAFTEEDRKKGRYDQTLFIILATLSNALSFLGIVTRVALPIAFGVTAIFSPEILFALSIAGLTADMAWWAHMHFQVAYNYFFPEWQEAKTKIEKHRAPKPTPQLKPTNDMSWIEWISKKWSTLSSTTSFQNSLILVTNLMFNIETAMMIFLPTVLGLASPILVVGAFAILSVTGLFDAVSAYVRYNDEMAQYNAAKIQDNITKPELDVIEKKIRDAKRSLRWNIAYNVGTMTGLTGGFVFLFFVPMAPMLTFITASVIAAATFFRIALRLVNPAGVTEVSVQPPEGVDKDALIEQAKKDPNVLVDLVYEHNSVRAAFLSHFGKNKHAEIGGHTPKRRLVDGAQEEERRGFDLGFGF